MMKNWLAAGATALSAGIRYEEGEVAWCHEVLDVLEEDE